MDIYKCQTSLLEKIIIMTMMMMMMIMMNKFMSVSCDITVYWNYLSLTLAILFITVFRIFHIVVFLRRVMYIAKFDI